MSDDALLHDPWYPGGDPDAMHWVEEFYRIYPDAPPDADTMLGWFANAIETGRAVEAARAALAAPSPAPLEPVEVEVRQPVGAVLSVRVPGDLAVSLDAEARERGVKMSEVIREALERRNGPWTSATIPAVNVTWPASSAPLDVDAFLRSFATRGELSQEWRDGIEYARLTLPRAYAEDREP